jgi:hypothetical protein
MSRKITPCFLEVFANGVVDDFGLVLRRNPRQELPLRLRDAEFVEGVFDVRWDVVPVLLGTVIGGTQVVEDVVEIDLAQVRGRPRGQRLPPENIQRLQAKLEHPIGFLLVS